jgi:nucleoside 2-deoxyribosyltransferase
VIIAEITPVNANVFYELGYAHALEKPTILLANRKTEKLPFDVSGYRVIFYDDTIGGKSNIESTLTEHLKNIRMGQTD